MNKRTYSMKLTFYKATLWYQQTKGQIDNPTRENTEARNRPHSHSRWTKVSSQSCKEGYKSARMPVH